MSRYYVKGKDHSAFEEQMWRAVRPTQAIPGRWIPELYHLDELDRRTFGWWRGL